MLKKQIIMFNKVHLIIIVLKTKSLGRKKMLKLPKMQL
jgi:hypothetical protein